MGIFRRYPIRHAIHSQTIVALSSSKSIDYHEEMSARKQWVLIAVLSALIVGGVWEGIGLYNRPVKPSLDFCRTHCGLDEDEINWLINLHKGSGISRQEAIEMFRETFNDDPPSSNSSECLPCTLAILDAAGITE